VKKSVIFLALVAGLIGIGIVLSVLGNSLIFEDLSKGDGDVFSGQDLTIKTDLDQTQTGIYAVQINDVESALVSVSILDPLNSEIETHHITEELYEGVFEVSTSGTYKLLIENTGEEVKVFGVIGPEPDAWKRSLDLISFIILAGGLIGMVVFFFYIIINRKKDLS
jgi:hypothetical protein